jgi:nitronate monooxygenase
VQDSRLPIAVSSAGGLGSLPAAMLSLQQLEEQLSALSVYSHLHFNINFFAHTNPAPDDAAQSRWQQALSPFYAEHGIDPSTVGAGPGRAPFSEASCESVERFKPKVVSFHFGLPEQRLLARVKATGAQVWGSATTVAEGLWLQQHGADAVIAQGLEAGGHRGHFLSHDLSLQMGTLALTSQLVRALQLPVIAAGGIADVNGVRAAMALGASAAQIGTAFLLCHEATTSQVHRAALQSAGASHTQLTTLFTGRPARGIVNRLMRELGPMPACAPQFPTATAAIAPLRAAAEANGLGDFSPLWSGQNTSGCAGVSAAALLRQLSPVV